MAYRRMLKKRSIRSYRKKRSALGRKPIGVSWGKFLVSKIPQIARGVATIASLVNSEAKFIDNVNSTVATDSGAVFPLTLLGQGDTDENRNGNSILLKDLILRGRVVINSNSTTGTAHCRRIIFVDTACQGATPAVTDVLDTATPLSPLNMNNSKRFVILHDENISVMTGGRQFVLQKKYLKLPFHVKYIGTGSTVASQGLNGVFMLEISSEASNQPTMTSNIRIKFYDN